MNNWKELIIRLDRHAVGAEEVADMIYEYLVRKLEDDPDHHYVVEERIIDDIKSFVWRGVWE
ncbi:hypothetical protein [Alkalihalobacillus sp. BA299]|uniref:hypothetical protein n=1 Tax=Alkalihalobacillus sp. BA299 TaxID=2815938 RepID=UPI001ADC4FD4|nr:hypothetical protein [Alkalihalobacillus sp. BA299]